MTLPGHFTEEDVQAVQEALNTVASAHQRIIDEFSGQLLFIRKEELMRGLD